MGRIRRQVAPCRAGAVARLRAGRRRGPVLPERRFPRPGARIVPRDPIGRRPRQSPPADRRRPGGRPRGAVQGSPVHRVSPGPRLLPLLLPGRSHGGRAGRRDRRRTPRGRDRRELRAGPRRGQQPRKSRDRGPRLLRGPAHRCRSRNRFREGFSLPGDPPGRETFPGSRGYVRRLARCAAGRPRRKGDAPPPRTAPFPPRRARRDPGAHDRPRDVHRARPRRAGHPVPEDPSRPAAGTPAVSRDAHFRRAGDEGDRGSARHRGGGDPRRDGRVRRRARVPRGKRTGGGDRPPCPGDYRPPGVPADGGGGGGPVGEASGVGGVERTLSAGDAVGGGGESSASFFTSAGGLGKYRANISGR